MTESNKKAIPHPSVTIVGHVCIDHNTIDGVFSEKWGSSPMYIANYLQDTYDIQASILAPYGASFQKYTEGFHLLNKASGLHTLIYKNIVTNGYRVQFCSNAEIGIIPEITPEVIFTLGKTDILIVTPMTTYLNPEYILNIIAHTPMTTLKVLLPQGYMREIDNNGAVSKRVFTEAALLLSKFDILVASDEDYANTSYWAKQWTESNDSLSVIITRADKGATLFKGGKQTDVLTTPIPFENINNPVGSGDIFSAQLSISLHSGLDKIKAIEVANKATAKSLISK